MPASEDPREQAIEKILSDLKEKLRRELDLNPASLDEMEDQTQRIGEEFKKQLDRELAKRKGKDQQALAKSTPVALCVCGRKARCLGLRTRHLVLLSGVHAFRRAYYYCSDCHQGFSPMDAWLGAGSGQSSRRVVTLTARLSCYLTDRLVAREMEQLFGIVLSVHTVQRYSRQVGSALQTEWTLQRAHLQQGKLAGSVEYPKRLHNTMDGVMVHVGGGWREAKVGVSYQTGASGETMKTRYYATLASSAQFGQGLRVLAHQSGSDHCADVAVVADGAEWIWQEVAKHFPRSTQVLDYYHATQHLWEMAHLRFGKPSSDGAQNVEAQEWMDQQTDRLMQNKIGDVLAAVQEWSPRQEQKRVVRRRLLGYLTQHQLRMQYQTFTQAGYHIGSGVAESACKNVVQIRMKRAGMRWSEAGAESMLGLCTWYSSYGQKELASYVN